MIDEEMPYQETLLGINTPNSTLGYIDDLIVFRESTLRVHISNLAGNGGENWKIGFYDEERLFCLAGKTDL